MVTRVSLRILIGLALLAASLGVTPSPALAADGVVGTGTPASCTEAAFNTVLAAVQASSGTITFNCGAAMHTIVFTAPKAITSAVAIDGAGRITLGGGNTTSLFIVNFGGALTIRELSLTRSGGPAIGNFGRLDVIDSQFLQNAATNGPGGAISSSGTAALTNTLIISNTASQHGGGLYNGGTMTINGGQISGNLATMTGGGLYNAGSLIINAGQITGNQAIRTGGGIHNIGTLTVTGSSLTNNRAATAAGGALFDNGVIARISNSLIQANSSELGGGITHVGGELTLDQVLVANNEAVLQGGGLWLDGPGVFSLTAVTVSGNRANAGGGIIQSGGSLTLRNSTLSGNQALANGGGLYLAGDAASIRQVTITGNTLGPDPSVSRGAGIYHSGGTLDLTNSLLSNNRRPVNGISFDCYQVGGATLTASFSLSSDDTCGFGTGRDNIALPLGPLQNNGGFTPTHLLPQGSPAIDAGSSAGCPAVDQRGLSRPVGAACDVGAIEARASDFIKQVFLPTLQK